MERIWNVTKEGYIFPKDKVNASIDSDVLVNYLDSMVAYGLCKSNGTDFVINHKDAASLTADDKELLGLPPIFPYQISVFDGRGDLGHNDFRYAISLIKPDGSRFINPKVIGSYVKIDNQREYTFDQYQYSIIDLAITCNQEVAKKVGIQAAHFNLLNVAKMQDYTTEAEAEVSAHIESTKVVVPEKLSVDFEKSKINGLYYAKPILLKKNKRNETYEEIASNAFSDAFSANDKVSDVYLGEDGTKYVISEDVKQGLNSIKKVNYLNQEEYERFRVQPREIFDENIFVFPDGLYSDRVVDFTNVKYKGYTIEGLNEGGWLPEEGYSGIDSIEITPDNVDEIDKKVQEAEEQGQDHIEVNGTLVTISRKLKEDIKQARVKSNEKDNPIDEFGPDDPDERKSKSVVLDVMKNDERLEYISKNKLRNIHGSFSNGLKPEIVLYEHQLAGINWMYKQWCDGYKGVLLADDMGLGKTLQTLAFVSGIMKNFPDYANNPILIVAPVSLLKNWKNEILQFVDSDTYNEIIDLHSHNLKRFKVGHKLDLSSFSSAYQKCIVLTTYETLRDHQLDFGIVPWSVIIADEAQKIKNPSATQTYALKGMKYDFAVSLSGTPVENTWIDLWSIMDFTQPGLLGNFKWFRDEYHNKLKQNKHDLIVIQKLGEKLQNQLNPLFLRRLKKEHLKGLPVKSTMQCRCTMPSIQQEAYINAIQQYKCYGGHGFEIIAKLRDISLHPKLAELSIKSLPNMDIDEVINSSARLKKTFEILCTVRDKGEKALIFVISKKMQLILQYIIQKKFRINVATPINGDMNGERRQSVIDNFEAIEGFSVLILSPEAAGVGLNITCANHVIHLSRTWNPAKEDQATDRAYRIGQKKDVTVYIPMAICPSCGENSSFDEKLDKLLSFKRTLSENVLFPTPESTEDYQNIINGLNINDANTDTFSYYTIDDMKYMTGAFFEKVLRQLYENMGYDALKTPDSKDRGADILAWKDKTRREGILIQTKQTSTEDNMNGDGVQEVVASLAHYSKKYPECNWTLAVITNARDFTAGAKELSRDNGVKLIARNSLTNMLKDFPVIKF